MMACKHEWPAPVYENGKRVFPEACLKCGGLRPSAKDIAYAEKHAERLGLTSSRPTLEED